MPTLKKAVVLMALASSICMGQTGELNIVGGQINLSTATHTATVKVVANVGALPASGCVAGELAVVTAATLGQQIYQNSSTGACTWTQQLNTGSSNGGGITVYSAPSVSLTGTQYIPIGGGGLPNATETNVDTPSPSAATVTNLEAQLSSAPGIGNSVAFTWRKNAASQSLTCTISGAVATSCSDSTHSFAVSQGDLLTIQLVTTGIIAGTPNLITAVQFGTTQAGGTVNTGTQNQTAKYAANGTTVSGSTVLSDDATNAYVDGPLDIKGNSLVIEIPNSGSPGTTLNKLVKIPAAVASVLTTSTADQISAVGIVIGGAGTTGNAKIGVLGQFSCLFDNIATTAGDFVIPSSVTAATCSDAGAAYPSSGEVMGQVLSSRAACGSPPCGPYTVVFGTPDITLPGAQGSNGNNGNGNSGNGAKQQLHAVTFVIDGGGSAITTGDKGIYPTADFGCTINRIDISADQSGSITVDVWKRAGAIPTSGQKISASAPLTLSTAQLAQNGSLSGWTKTVAIGDVFGFSVASATTVTRVIGQIWCQ